MESSNFVFEEKSEKKQIKSFAKYNNIKADYFLQKVFNNLEKKRVLNIIKYNKNMQKRINLNNINDYKEYSEIYSSIEIEIIPIKCVYGQFIYIKEDESYYHIYINDNKKETNKYSINKDDKISKIKIIID